MTPLSNKDTATGASDDTARAADTDVKAAYNLEATTPYYPDTEGGESMTTEDDSVSVSRVEEPGHWVSCVTR